MRIWCAILTAIAAVVGLAAIPSRAEAWGREGHDLVGKIANQFLTNKARNAINELLLNHQFQSLADGRLTNWADTIRSSAAFKKKYPKMSSWHFIDVDVNADLKTIKLDDFCQNQDCALGAIKKFQAILKDPAKPAQERREALFFLAHFIGDIHQPLHCAERNNDKGGNLVKVRLEADDPHVTNLHKVWDTELVREALGPLSIKDYATRLTNTLSTGQRKKFRAGSVEDWILEGHKIARAKVYVDGNTTIPSAGPPHVLSSDYVLNGAEIVEEQLTKGGVRLAQFLNDTFKD